MLNINIKILPNGKDLPLPKYQTPLSAGLDLIAALSTDIELENMEYKLIPTGIAIAIPTGYEAQIRPRSGLAVKHGVTVLNSPGTIDADYRGEIKVCLINFNEETFVITRGMRIAQLIINKIETSDWVIVTDLEETVRGESGFGSTGT